MLPTRYSEEESALREILRDARTKAGLRQADLAARMGVPQSFVSKYESGERVLSFVETVAILDLLGVSATIAAKTILNLRHAAKS